MRLVISESINNISSVTETEINLIISDFDTGGRASSLYPYSVPASDHSAYGIIEEFTANEAQAFGDVCYVNSDGEMQIADADTIASAVVVAMAIESIAADGTGDYLLFGTARDDTWAWTPGGKIFLTVTGTTGNTLSQSAPSAEDDCVVIVGVATHADRMIFKPESVIVEHA